MPPILAIQNITNGIRVTCVDKTIGNQGVVSFVRSDLPANLVSSTNTAAIETHINNALKTALTFTDGNGVNRWKFYAVVHVYSNSGGTLRAVSSAVDFTGLSTDPVPSLGVWW